MQFSLLRLVLPAAMALVTLMPTADASPKKVDWDIQFGSQGHLGVRIGTPGFPRRSVRRSSRCITPSRGYWKTISEQVWVQGRSHQEYVPAVYETFYDSHGNAHRVLVCEASYRTVQEPGHYETRSRRIWVPARRSITRSRRRR